MILLTFTSTLSTHSNFPPAFRHLSLFTAIDRSVSLFSISCNSEISRWTSSLFIADTSLDNSSVLRRNSLVSDDMLVSIVSPPPPSGSDDKSFPWKFRDIVNHDEKKRGRGGRKEKSNRRFLLSTLSFLFAKFIITYVYNRRIVESFWKEEEKRGENNFSILYFKWINVSWVLFRWF